MQKAIEEHQQIKEQVELLKTSAGEEAAKLLSALADKVDAHVRYEEKEVFPHIEKVLTGTQLEAVGKQLKAEPIAGDEYPDEFWKNR